MVKPLRVCWWAPWFRSLAQNYIAMTAGSDTQWWLLTSDSHMDSTIAQAEQEVCIRSSNNWRSKPRYFLQTLRALYRIKPDVIISDIPERAAQLVLTLFVAHWRPTAVIVHDAEPHDRSHSRSAAVETLQRRLIKASRIVIAMSAHTEAQLHAKGITNTCQLPLLPESPTLSDLVPQANRRHFTMVGRWSEYKGFDIGLEAFTRFRESTGSTDELHLWLSGASAFDSLPDGVVCRSLEGFTWQQLTSALPGYRAVLLPYRHATQSGVQVLAWAVGVPALVADLPGLSQLQPPLLPAIPTDQLDAWVEAMDTLAQGDSAALLGAQGRAWMQERIHPDVIRTALNTCVTACLGKREHN